MLDIYVIYYDYCFQKKEKLKEEWTMWSLGLMLKYIYTYEQSVQIDCVLIT